MLIQAEHGSVQSQGLKEVWATTAGIRVRVISDIAYLLLPLSARNEELKNLLDVLNVCC